MAANPHLVQIDNLLGVYRDRHVQLLGLQDKLIEVERETTGAHLFKVKREIELIKSKMAFYQHEIDVLMQMRARYTPTE